MSPRLRLALVAAVFLAPIAASLVAYRFFRPERTSNYGELLLPPARLPAAGFSRFPQGPFAFEALHGRWVLVVADSGDCPASCRDKLTTIRQLRLAVGRDAERVERVFVVDDARRPDPRLLEAYPGLAIALAPPGTQGGPGPSNDRAHIYLADPLGNVMLRWPAAPDPKRMIRDLERLLKASQVG